MIGELTTRMKGPRQNKAPKPPRVNKAGFDKDRRGEREKMLKRLQNCLTYVRRMFVRNIYRKDLGLTRIWGTNGGCEI